MVHFYSATTKIYQRLTGTLLLRRSQLEESLENSLRTWHFEDPPDEWEEKRNDLIEVVQGNRNPFIDQPELVEQYSGPRF